MTSLIFGKSTQCYPLSHQNKKKLNKYSDKNIRSTYQCFLNQCNLLYTIFTIATKKTFIFFLFLRLDIAISLAQIYFSKFIEYRWFDKSSRISPRLWHLKNSFIL